MEIVVYYRLAEDEPTKIRHTFKQDEPLESFFAGPTRSVGRLEVFENGSVVFKQNGWGSCGIWDGLKNKFKVNELLKREKPFLFLISH